MFARGLEQVRDFEDVAGDLEVVVAVHGVRWFLGEEWGLAGVAHRPPGPRTARMPCQGVRQRDGSRVGTDSEAAGARVAQQLEQQQQLQRARAAPWDPVVRVEASAEFASMPTRTAVHTFSVNSAPGMWDMVHLIRFMSEAKGLCIRVAGHMAHNRAHKPRCDPVIRL
jgi:hypothetical protein